jgi:hypothetical protein
MIFAIIGIAIAAAIIAGGVTAMLDRKDRYRTGICECNHSRCRHTNGKGPCHEAILNNGVVRRYCTCQVFIPKGDGGCGNDGNNQPVDPEVEELRRMYKM